MRCWRPAVPARVLAFPAHRVHHASGVVGLA